MYLASGIPVIIWREAAEADFVKKNNLGICVSSLKEAEGRINMCSEDQYQTYCRSVQEVQMKLQEGFFTKKAINQAENIFINKD